MKKDKTPSAISRLMEYAGSYIESPEPYKNLLELLRRHLAPGGRLLLAIENRLHSCPPQLGTFVQ